MRACICRTLVAQTAVFPAFARRVALYQGYVTEYDLHDRVAVEYWISVCTWLCFFAGLLGGFKAASVDLPPLTVAGAGLVSDYHRKQLADHGDVDSLFCGLGTEHVPLEIPTLTHHLAISLTH